MSTGTPERRHDAPAWDAEATERYRLPVLAEIYSAHGRDDLARACRELVAQTDLFANGYNFELLAGLDELGVAWELYDRSAGALLEPGGRKQPNPDASALAGLKLLNDEGIFEDLTPLLSELTMPARLIVGEADLVTSPAQIDAFTRRVGSQYVNIVERAGHHVHAERPDVYRRLVFDFIADVERQRVSS